MLPPSTTAAAAEDRLIIVAARLLGLVKLFASYLLACQGLHMCIVHWSPS